MTRAGSSHAAARDFAHALESGAIQLTTAVIPGDEDDLDLHGRPVPNFERWALERYCFDAKGRVDPGLVDGLDKWSLDRMEQIRALGVVAADTAATWTDFLQDRAKARQEALAAAGAGAGGGGSGRRR